MRSLLCLAALTALLAAPAPSTAAPKPLPGRLASALAVPHVSPAWSAAVAVDLQTHELVYTRQSALPLAPASVEKLAVSYTLLVRLGPAHRIETHVLGQGGLDGTTWVGNVVLKGHGDPTLSSGDLRRLAQALRGQGIERIEGDVLGDESFFDAKRVCPGWKPSYYIGESPPLSALTVDRARYRGRTSASPALAAAALFRQALVGAGVAVTGRADVGAAAGDEVELARTASASLLELLRAVNRESDNFTAETLLKHLGGVETGVGTTAAGAAVVLRALREAGVPVAGVRVVDGSGLSLLDRLTGDAVVGILLVAWDDPLLRGSFVASLAVAGVNGTLERRLRRVRGTVFAKTGTTSRASALAGYVADRYAFAVLQNGWPISSWWARVAQDRFVTTLATS
jgi:D-alanyl-D-alanine carboxypeptidase/D-alanyl-D-alanine-endopeptidase (penicillin-binding protein 4)